MEASPVSVGSGKKSSFTIELAGTNVLRAAASGTCGVEMLQLTELNFTGEGRLEVQGVGPGIGMGQGEVSDQSSVIVHSGEIVAAGGNSAAGIGGGGGQGGIRTYIYGGKVVATGGSGAAGIGGGNNMDGAAFVITNGIVVATGGTGGAGIGGGQGGDGNVGSEACQISGGIVTATGGSGAAGIGGGQGGNAGRYRQLGGTVVARGGGNYDIGPGIGGIGGASSTTILGGSLDSYSDRLSPAAKNASNALLYCVTVPTRRPNFDVGAVMSDFNGYSLNGVVTDDEGKIYIWLPDGEYHLNIGKVPFRAVVDGADTVAEEWYVGVEVNGDDVALQSGEGWKYLVDSKILNVFGGGCTVSGTNTTGDVYLQFTNSVSAVVSNLFITTVLTSTEAPVSVVSNANVKLSIAGESAFRSEANKCAGVNVPHGSTLSITNLDMTVAVPDLDNIVVITNTLYDIEYDDDGNPKIDPDTGCVITNGVIYDIHAETNYIDKVVVGALSARGGVWGSGIGGGNLQSHGTIEISGGVIEASAGGSFCAGIGAGYFPDSGEGFADAETLRQGVIRIRGGEVNAKGGSYGAGIGGGNRHSGGVIEISGGLVNATGGSTGSGIGGGWGARGHTIEISGGEVFAKGGEYAAGIGGGKESNKSLSNTEISQISISGGRVTALGGEGGSGIGGGRSDTESAAVNISGGTVVATAGDALYGYSDPDDIGLGACSNSGVILHTLTIRGASVHATHRTSGHERVSPAPSNGTERVYCVTVETAKTNELVEVSYLGGFSKGSDIYADENGRIYLWLPNGTHIFYVDEEPRTVTVDGADAMAALWLTGVTIDGVDAARRMGGGQAWYYDFGQRQLMIIEDCVVSGTDTAGYVNILAWPLEGKGGGGEPEMSLTISNLCLKTTKGAAPFTVTNGLVTVCLDGENILDASGCWECAGLAVLSGASLSLTNLDENAALEAYGGKYAAGIGGGFKMTVGDINIHGGSIRAKGGDEYGGAGIGCGFRGVAGSIYISGGLIEAHGGLRRVGTSYWCGAGIGGADSATVGEGSVIAISGGTVNSYGAYGTDSKYAADIGTGYDGSGKFTIEISGGSVHPEASDPGRYFTKSNGDTVTPENSSGQIVHKVTLDGFTPNAKVEMTFPGYGTNDIYADGSGEIWLWLADGEHYYSINGRRFATNIEGGTATTVEIPDSYGVEVDGVDVANLSGDVWRYEVFSQRLTVTNACVISGTNTEGKINISVDATEEFALTISNLYLKATSGSPLTVLHGTNTLCLVGTNVLDAADAAGYSGLHVATMYEGVIITNLHDGAKLVAKGGENAAGIGAGNSDIGGNIEILGGIVEATGGANGTGIGGSQKYGFVGVVIRGGTVRPIAGTGAKAIGYGSSVSVVFGSEKIVFTGGSVATDYASIGAGMGTYVVNADGTKVYPVEISGFTPNEKASIEIDGYGTYDIYADSEGKVYPWLWVGDYIFIIRGMPYRAHVTTSGAVAEPWLSGVMANGTDVAYLHDESGKWNYRAADRTLYISSGTSPDDCVTVTGTNTESYVHVAATNGIYLVLSNLCIVSSNAAPVSVSAQNATVTVAFAGTNTLDASQARDVAGLQTGSSSVNQTYLSLTNLEESAAIVAKGGSAGAGIGGGYCNPSGVNSVYVNIYGGKITATGGLNGAGIGGGANGNAEVNIYGGEIKAMGGSNATGIGSGNGKTGRVNIWGGIVDATSGSGTAAGIGGGGSSYAYVYIYGGIVNATSKGSGMAIGAGSYSMGYVYISGGTVVPKPYTYATSKSIGSTRDGYGEVRFTGGSINVALDKTTPAPTNGSGGESGDPVYCVTVDGLTPNAKVAFDGLPDYYGKNDIYADASGQAYLWLPEDWDKTHDIEPKYLLASPKKGLLGAPSGTAHTFSANGYSYTVTIDPDAGGAVAEQGDPLPLESLAIDDFAVEDGYLAIRFTAKPATWLYGFADLIKVRASGVLPIPDTAEALLDLSAAELTLEGEDSATIVVPVGEGGPSRFFKVEAEAKSP